MSQEKYYIKLNGVLVEVTEGLYQYYYQSKRSIKYFQEDLKRKTPIRDQDGKVTGFAPSREISFEFLCDAGAKFASEEEPVEEMALHALMSDKLHKALDTLPESDRELIEALFFSNGGGGMSERDYAEISGIPRKTLAYRRAQILGKLKKLINN